MGRPSFAELLDEKLREAFESPSGPPPSTDGAFQAVPAPPLLFAAPYRVVEDGRYAKYGNSYAVSGRQGFADFADRLVEDERTYARTRSNDDRPTASDTRRQPSVEPSRRLNSSERHALAMLNRLGARLAPDFMRHELRTAYRALARRLHPDCHAISDPETRVRRSRLFAIATEHHRTLLRVIARETPTSAAGA